MHTANHSSSSFQALVQKSRAAGRLAAPVEAQPKPKMQQTGMRLWPEELAEAVQLAQAEERSAASFMRRVYLRGLDIYRAEHGLPPAAEAQGPSSN